MRLEPHCPVLVGETVDDGLQRLFLRRLRQEPDRVQQWHKPHDKRGLFRGPFLTIPRGWREWPTRRKPSCPTSSPCRRSPSLARSTRPFASGRTNTSTACEPRNPFTVTWSWGGCS